MSENQKDIDERRKRQRLKARKQRQMEQQALEESKSLAKTRIAVALAVGAVVFIASFLISGRSGWILEWPISWLSAFVALKVTTIVTIVAAVVVAALYFALPVFMTKKKNYSDTRARTLSITLSSIALMVSVGVVIPGAAWFEARDFLPAVKFDRCVDSLRDDAVVALNDGKNGTKYATIASVENGINKYALEPGENGHWQVTDMHTNESVDNLAGC